MPWVRALAVLVSFLTANPSDAGFREVTVDCDKGDDLAAVLTRILAGADGPVVVDVVGTCSGPIEIRANDVTLRGRSPGASAIVGVRGGGASAAPAIVRAHAVRNLRLSKLRIAEGPVGVAATTAEVTIEGCDIARTDVGVLSQGASVALSGVTLHDGRIGIESRRSRIDVGFSTIQGISDEGISATEFSEVVLFRTTAASDGLSADHSMLVATHCELEGSIHARSYSRVSLAGTGGSTAALRGSLTASNSEVLLFQLPIEGTIAVHDNGALTAIGADLERVVVGHGTTARISAGRVARDIRADGFSTLQLLSTAVLGDVVCERGSDAICEHSELTRVSGCRSCDAGDAPAGYRTRASSSVWSSTWGP